jgi:acetyl esterase/lipase
VLLFLHGGAWRAGHRNWMGFMAPLFLDLPAIFVSACYRLAPAHRFPAHLDDTIEALAWVNREIGRFGGDPGRIHIGGHSAGGHLAALAAVRSDLRAARGIPARALCGCLPVSGSFDFRAPPESRDRVQTIIYDEVLARPDQDAEASPIVWAERLDVPILITFGGNDWPRLRAQAPAMIARLETVGRVPVSWLELPGAGHFDTSQDCTDISHPWVAEARRLLGGGTPHKGELAACAAST